ncbi:MAG: hypothetical protein GY727_02150 [Gammaproteobacteria bacterium]|nr:hypothetical protein [Gammaproteobacteria bacterium]MCP4088871.1 hypothetical protein [Gammaproteobacteria bacterium]MCP4274887.1 hypothetical protein [Gammaproteobacteria bacterium]MCP4832046.1 hypothetical protein [Gammaproteobacteria bacterium]MCP4928353.1 hypothetical protein [Gammaproteobacteria bacterium]
MHDLNETKIAISGLGYVGLPLAFEFSKCIQAIGFDATPVRIDKLAVGKGSIFDIFKEEIAATDKFSFVRDV